MVWYDFTNMQGRLCWYPGISLLTVVCKAIYLGNVENGAGAETGAGLGGKIQMTKSVARYSSALK